MAGAAAHLKFAQLIAGEDEEQLDVVKEEVHLQMATEAQSGAGTGALQLYRPYRMGQEGEGQPEGADARRARARRMLQRLQLAGGSVRWKT
jgi:hypothetical protein